MTEKEAKKLSGHYKNCWKNKKILKQSVAHYYQNVVAGFRVDDSRVPAK